MARYAKPGQPISISFDAPTAGLVGTFGVRVQTAAGVVVVPRSTADVTEAPAGSGIYTWTGTAPEAVGDYLVVGDDATGTPAGTAAEALVVTRSGLPALGQAPPGIGPCSLWTSPEAVGDACEVPEGADVEYAVQVASAILWSLSGRRFSGRCRAVVRPQERIDRHRCPPLYVGAGGPWPRECYRLDQIKLAGYPIREVEEVKIDGVALDPSDYALYGRHLLRADGQSWPSCQRLDRPTTEPGTFEVTYLYGADPPLPGQHAAAKLACQIAKGLAAEPCDLPPNVSRVLRQGVQVNVDAARALSGRLGVPEVDVFLAAFPGPRRRPAIASPDRRPFPIVTHTEPAPEES